MFAALVAAFAAAALSASPAGQGQAVRGGPMKDAALIVGNFQPMGATDGILRYDGAGRFLDSMVPVGTAGLLGPCCAVFGPDENLYASNAPGGNVLRFNGVTGAFIDEFIPAGTGNLLFPVWMVFHSDGYLYVGDSLKGSIHRFDATTGAYVDEFIQGALQGLVPWDPQGFAAGPDGDWYVAASQGHRVLRYNGETGAYMGDAVPADSGALGPTGIAFREDGSMLVGFAGTNEIRRYDVSGSGPAELLGVFVPPGDVSIPVGLTFGPDKNLYVANAGTAEVLRFDGMTGEFIDAFVEAGAGGLTGPRVLAWKAKTKVCHAPGNGNARPHTLSIGYLSAFDHLEHGDTLGPCR